MMIRPKNVPRTSTLAVLPALALVLSLATAACQEQPATDDSAATDTAATDTAATDTAATDTAATDTRVGAAGDVTAPDAPIAAPGASDPGSAGTRAALPRLFTVMVGLQGDMERISRGIWTERYDSIAAAARAVADHPTIGSEGIAKVQGVLGEDMAAFKGMDMTVHDLAVEVEEHAAAGDLEAVLDAEVRLRQGCVECHTAFRQRLRDAF